MPAHVSGWLNRGPAFAAVNRHQDASSYAARWRCTRTMLTHSSTEALSLLTVGDYRRGFQYYEGAGSAAA